MTLFEKGGRGGAKIVWTLELNDVSSVCIYQFINQSVEQDFWSTSESSQLLFFPNPTHHAQFLIKDNKGGPCINVNCEIGKSISVFGEGVTKKRIFYSQADHERLSPPPPYGQLLVELF